MTFTIDKKRATTAFNRAAATYDAHDFLQREVGSRALEQLDYLVINPEKILDLGAGTGRFSRNLARKYKKASVYLLDFAIKMLYQARTKRRFKLFSKDHYICGDIEALPISDGQIDLVFTSLALQWSTQLHQSVSEIRRIMSSGGLFLFATLGPDTLYELREAFHKVSLSPHVNDFLDMHEVGDVLSSNGFSDPVLSTERIVVEYDDVKKLMRDLKGIGASNSARERPRALTGKRRLNSMIQAYDKLRVDNKIPATYEVIIGHAWALDGKHKKVNLEHTFPLNRLRRR